MANSKGRSIAPQDEGSGTKHREEGYYYYYVITVLVLSHARGTGGALLVPPCSRTLGTAPPFGRVLVDVVTHVHLFLMSPGMFASCYLQPVEPQTQPRTAAC